MIFKADKFDHSSLSNALGDAFNVVSTSSTIGPLVQVEKSNATMVRKDRLLFSCSGDCRVVYGIFLERELSTGKLVH
jgi:hypothetical protein